MSPFQERSSRRPHLPNPIKNLVQKHTYHLCSPKKGRILEIIQGIASVQNNKKLQSSTTLANGMPNS
jgi:hypothetical protein